MNILFDRMVDSLTPQPEEVRAKLSGTTFAQRLRAAMAAQGIKNGTELAKLLRVPKQTSYRWMRGDIKNLTYVNLYALADALNVAARWLALGDVSPLYRVVRDPKELALIDHARVLPHEIRAQLLVVAGSLAATHADKEVDVIASREHQKVRPKQRATLARRQRGVAGKLQPGEGGD